MRKVNAKKKQRKETERSQDISDSAADENEYQEDSKNGGSDGNSVDVAREKKGKKGNRERAQNENSAKEKENIEEVEEYEVEDVLDHKIDNGVSYFLIKWKGYDSENNTWEPEDTLSCPDLVSKYKKRAQARKPTKEAVPKKKLKANNEDQTNTDPNQEWEVEKIVDVEYDRNGARLFRIRWKGYRPSSDTWEPEEHLNCGDLIEKFLKKHNKKGELSQKELREAPRQTKRFVTGTFGRRSSKRNSGRIRTVYYDAE